MSLYRLKGTAGPLINQSFELSARLLIGSANDCDIRIEAAGVAPHHAEVLPSDQGRVKVRALDPAAKTRVNGEVATEASLSGGDEIQVGNCRLMLQAPGLRPERILHGEAVTAPGRRWPWWVLALMAAAVALAWRQGLLDEILSLLGGG